MSVVDRIFAEVSSVPQPTYRRTGSSLQNVTYAPRRNNTGNRYKINNSRRSQQRRRNGGYRQSNDVCYSCGETGHYARDCPQRISVRGYSSRPTAGAAAGAYYCTGTVTFPPACSLHNPSAEITINARVSPACKGNCIYGTPVRGTAEERKEVITVVQAPSRKVVQSNWGKIQQVYHQKSSRLVCDLNKARSLPAWSP